MTKSIAYYKTVETMNDYKIPILIGLRRTGKSTILKQIKEENQSAKMLSIDRLKFRVYDHIATLTMLGKTYLFNCVKRVKFSVDFSIKLCEILEVFSTKKLTNLNALFCY